MADIRFSCCYCKQRFCVDASFEGQTAACPVCGNDILIKADTKPVKITSSSETAENQQKNQEQISSVIEVVSYGAGFSSGSGEKILAGYRTNERKNRIVFILLGIFFGGLGIHNFYAGYNDDGKKQLCVTLATDCGFPLLFALLGGLSGFMMSLLFVVIGGLIVLIWVINDLLTKDCDADGIPMEI